MISTNVLKFVLDILQCQDLVVVFLSHKCTVQVSLIDITAKIGANIIQLHYIVDEIQLVG